MPPSPAFDGYVVEYLIGDELLVSGPVDGAVNVVVPVPDGAQGFLSGDDYDHLLFGSVTRGQFIPFVVASAGGMTEFDDWGSLVFGTYQGAVLDTLLPAQSDQANEVSMFAKFWRPGDDCNEVILGAPEEQTDDGGVFALDRGIVMVPVNIQSCFIFLRTEGWQYRPLRSFVRFLGGRRQEDIVTPYVPVNL